MPPAPTSSRCPRVPLAAPGCDGARLSRRVLRERTCPPRAADRPATTSDALRPQRPRCRQGDSSGSPDHRRVQGDAIHPGRGVGLHTRTVSADEERPARGWRHQGRVPRPVPCAPSPRATRHPRYARQVDTNTARGRDPDQTGATGGLVGRTGAHARLGAGSRVVASSCRSLGVDGGRVNEADRGRMKYTLGASGTICWVSNDSRSQWQGEACGLPDGHETSRADQGARRIGRIQALGDLLPCPGLWKPPYCPRIPRRRLVRPHRTGGGESCEPSAAWHLFRPLGFSAWP
jgi:hypothetical protein